MAEVGVIIILDICPQIAINPCMLLSPSHLKPMLANGVNLQFAQTLTEDENPPGPSMGMCTTGWLLTNQKYYQILPSVLKGVACLRRLEVGETASMLLVLRMQPAL